MSSAAMANSVLQKVNTRRPLGGPFLPNSAEAIDSPRVYNCPVTSPLSYVAGLHKMPPRTMDALIAGLLTSVLVGVAAWSEDFKATLLIATCLIGVALVWRRRFPTTVTLVVAIGSVATARNGGASDLFEPIALILCFFTVGQRSAVHGFKYLDAGLVIVAIPLIALAPTGKSAAAILSIWMSTVVVPIAVGWIIESRSVLAHKLRDEAARLAHEQREHARQLAGQERVRIARELHDIIAHNVSVMVIQTQAARSAAGRNIETASKALSAVERCGRESLIEMRRMIGVLRRDELQCDVPGLAQLSTLVDHAAASGIPVELRVHGQPYGLPPDLDLVVFRVVQEALTNVIKHAGPTQATVQIRFTETSLELDISDTGRYKKPIDAASEGCGHGLIGMRERLAIYGGELHAGERSCGGFEVQVRIPISETTQT
jgi:signal transduction histidine kinase